MKKTFKIEHPKTKVPRLFEAVKNEVRKYFKRERRKELPKGIDFWDFDCKYGTTAEEAEVVHWSELIQCIDKAEGQGLLSFYIEILAKPGRRMKKEKPREAAASSNTPSTEIGVAE